MKRIEINNELEEIETDTFFVDLWYPRNADSVDKVEVGLTDVRAADSILIQYDFDRDGWLIKQAKRFSWDADDRICDPEWTEVAFIQAWANEITEEKP